MARSPVSISPPRAPTFPSTCIRPIPTRESMLFRCRPTNLSVVPMLRGCWSLIAIFSSPRCPSAREEERSTTWEGRAPAQIDYSRAPRGARGRRDPVHHWRSTRRGGLPAEGNARAGANPRARNRAGPPRHRAAVRSSAHHGVRPVRSGAPRDHLVQRPRVCITISSPRCSTTSSASRTAQAARARAPTAIDCSASTEKRANVTGVWWPRAYSP